jgi:hypothetical protein
MTTIDYGALAREFVALCRAHGHDPRAEGDSFGIRLGVLTPTAPDEDYSVLGFDTSPFSALLTCRDNYSHVVAAILTANGIEQTGNADE